MKTKTKTKTPNKATKQPAKPKAKEKTIAQRVKEVRAAEPAPVIEVAPKEPRTVQFPNGFLSRLRIFAATHYGKGYTAQGILERAAVVELDRLEALAKADKLPPFSTK